MTLSSLGRSTPRSLLAGLALTALLKAQGGCDSQRVVQDPSNQLWLHQLGTAAADAFYSVSGAGNTIYAVGVTSGNVPANVGTTQPPDGLIAKLDGSGQVAWLRQFGTAGADEWDGVTVDGAGNAYVVGFTSGTYAGQTKVGGDTDAVIASVAPDGTLRWMQQFGTTGNDTLSAITSDSSGNLYAAGWTTGSFAGSTVSGGSDGFVVSYRSDGTQAWVSQFGSTQDDSLSGITLGSDGGLYVAGWAQGSVAGQQALGGRDGVIYKLGPTGSLIWARVLGTAADDEVGAVGVSGSVLYASGRTVGTLPGQTAAGTVDGLIASYDLAGTQRWVRQIGTAYDDVLPALAALADGSGVVVGGYVSRGLGSAKWLGQQDAIHIKMHSDGVEEWTSQFGSAGNDRVTSLYSPAAGILYTVGTTSGTLTGQTSVGSDDGFIARYQIP